MTRTNRLIHAQSPYLLQHAENPVDWYPWEEAAFDKAAAEDKPVFLSIGYSTCHWCHVMAHESFADDAVAKLLNEHFVSVKVDREERPDIDDIYMTVCQMMTNSGGWPLTIIMTPSQEPFFAATYIPKQSWQGRTGLMDLLPRVAEVWKNRRAEALDTGSRVKEALEKYSRLPPGDVPGTDALKTAYTILADSYDPVNGGFGSAPKFPSPHNFLFLLRYWYSSGEKKALEMVEKTLTEMRRGGMYDQIGFGFHRYSTDAQWLVPHFEKMLYDQALLAIAYLEAFQATGRERFARTAEEIFTYVLRDMTAPEGGFYSAEDADSEGREGKFYLWTQQEVQKLLGDTAESVLKTFCFAAEGNFFDPLEQKFTGENIPHLNRDPLQLEKKVLAAREKMFAHRENRVHPHKDDKILTDWNGLMIAALARGHQITGKAQYRDEAQKAINFIAKHLTSTDGELFHRYRNGQSGIPGQIDDYAFLIFGLIEMYEATFIPDYLERAASLMEIQTARFWDEKDGGFFSTADNGEMVLVRKKNLQDGAMPSGNAVAISNLIRLGRMTGNFQWEEMARQMFTAFSRLLTSNPAAFTHSLCALDFLLYPSCEIIVVGKTGTPDTDEMIRQIRRFFLPRKAVLFVPEGNHQIRTLVPFIRGYTMRDGRATAYVCHNLQCQAPITDPQKLTPQSINA